MLVQQRVTTFSPGVSDSSLSEQLAASYGLQLTAGPFLERVIADTETTLSLSQLKRMISVVINVNPPTIDIRVRSIDPELAAATADTLASEFIDYVIELRLAEIAQLQRVAAAQGLVTGQDLVTVQLSALDSMRRLEVSVDVPSRPILPRTRRNVVLGFMIAAAVAVGTAILMSSLRDTVKGPEEIVKRFGVPVLGTIFRWSSQEAEEHELMVHKSPSSTYSEAFRQIRASLQFLNGAQTKPVYVVTSPGPE